MKHSVLWAAIGAAFLVQGVAAQTTSESNSNANSGSVSGATAVSNPTVHVTPTSHNDSASNSSSGAVSGSVATGGQGGAGGAGGVSNVTSTPTANSSASTSSNSTASTNGNTQVIQFISPNPPNGPNQNTINPGQPQTQRIVTEGGTSNSTHLSGETTNRVEYSGTQTIRNVPSVQGPPLATSNDTCMGSSSGSINGPGFGIGIGSTWTDRNCVMLKNARELWNMGMKAAAMALFCTDVNNRMALEITGFVCPQTAARQRADAEADRVAQLEAEKKALATRLAALERGHRRQASGWPHGGGEHAHALPPPVHPSVVDASPAGAQVVVSVVPEPKVEPVKLEAAAPPPVKQYTIEKAIVAPASPSAEPQATVVRTVSQ